MASLITMAPELRKLEGCLLKAKASLSRADSALSFLTLEYLHPPLTERALEEDATLKLGLTAVKPSELVAFLLKKRLRFSKSSFRRLILLRLVRRINRLNKRCHFG